VSPVGLEGQFPKFAKMVNEFYPIKKITCVRLNWVDNEEQVITFDELIETILAIDSALANGNSVLVHCAQGGLCVFLDQARLLLLNLFC
jgi:hypothetical protein